MSHNAFPTIRMRRLRKTPALRDLVREHTVTMNDLIYPIFVEEGIDTVHRELRQIGSRGGAFDLSAATPIQAYSGSLSVTVSYN